MRVSYLIPSHNDFPALLATLRSLQEGVPVCVVDDGSRVPVAAQLEGEAFPFPLEVLRLEPGRGIAHALNHGLRHLYGRVDLLARLDAGDFSAPDRIAKQTAAFAADRELVLLGSWARFLSEAGETLFVSALPTEGPALRRGMYLNNMFVHPSVMMRLDAVEALGGYPTNREAAEDYALFFKLLERGRGANLPEPLVDYVVSDRSISSRKRRRQLLSRGRVLLDHWQPTVRCHYGLVRTALMFLMPRTLTTWLRRFIKVY